MKMYCPNCKSSELVSPNHGKYIGAIVGAAGALYSISQGARIGSVAGLPGVLMGGVTGALIAIVSAACAGANIGKRIDDEILQNLSCRSCNFKFSFSQ